MLYVYGVGFDPVGPPDVPGVGPGTGAFRSVGHGGVAALLGVVEPPGPAVTARNMNAHAHVADRVATSQTFLPARFGTVMADDHTVRATLLEPQREALVQTLRNLDGCVEMLLTVDHDVDTLLREALTASPSLARQRRRLAGRPAAASYYDRIALGEAARSEALALQARDLERLAEEMRSAVRAAVALSVPDGSTSRLAYLVEIEALDRFDATLERFAVAHAGRLHMDLVGPLAPWDFTEVHGPPADARNGRGRLRSMAEAGGR